MANTDIFLGSGASITFIPENDIYVGGRKVDNSAFNAADVDFTTIRVDSGFANNFSLVIDLYRGCLLEYYSAGDILLSTHRITSNTAEDISFTPLINAPAVNTYFVIKSYGAPVPAPTDTAKRLLSDEWFGVLESATFPTTEVETKQVNLSLGGSRNKTFAYRGITSYSGGNLGLVANHGAWLYYFLGKCTTLECKTVAAGTVLSTDTHRYVVANSTNNNSIFIEGTNEGGDNVSVGASRTIAGFTETGPIFRRAVGGKMCPPISEHDIITGKLGDVDVLVRPSGTTTIADAITYTFEEQNGDLLPSFALENSFSKLTGTNQYRTHVDTSETNESLNFVKIARGNRVNTLTMTANANEEVKITMDLMTRNVHNLAPTEVYDARSGVTNETLLFNYETTVNTGEQREPFFFSDGRFRVLGTDFLKIDTLTLTMNNNLQDKRFLGVGAKDVQEAIPAERTYELQFTGHVTDNQLYKALLNEAEDQSQTIELNFTKSNGENIILNFTDYFISANDFPMSDDKGPIAVAATVMPRNLSLCTVKTHWILQG